MPKLTFDDIIKQREKIEKELQDYVKDLAKLDTRFKKKAREGLDIYNGLVEGNKEIADLKQQVKAAFDTWNKMLIKLESINAELLMISKEVKATIPGLGQFDKPIDELSSGLAQCGGDMKDIKAEAEKFKAIKRLITNLTGDYNNLEDMAGRPEKKIDKPTLAIS